MVHAKVFWPKHAPISPARQPPVLEQYQLAAGPGTRPACGGTQLTEDLNPFALAQQKLDEAAAILNLDDATHQMLRWPQRELHVTVPT